MRHALLVVGLTMVAAAVLLFLRHDAPLGETPEGAWEAVLLVFGGVAAMMGAFAADHRIVQECFGHALE